MPNSDDKKTYKTLWSKLLKQRGLSQQMIAEMFNYSPSKVNMIVSDPTKLSLEFYESFKNIASFSKEEEALFTPYLETLKTSRANAEKLARLYTIIDVSELKKQEFFPHNIKKNDTEAMLGAIVEYFGQKDYNDLEPFLKNQIATTNSLFRRSSFGNDPSSANLFLFTQEVNKKIASQGLVSAKYNKKKLVTLTENVLPYTRDKDGLCRFITELQKTGVTVIHMKHLPKTYLDGASLMIKKKPVIVLTLRLAHNDNVWFSLLHELAHIINDEDILESGQPLLNEGTMAEVQERRREMRAESFAREKLAIQRIVDQGRSFEKPLSLENVQDVANSCNVGIDIALGALQYAKMVAYSSYNENKYNIKDRLSSMLEDKTILCK